MNKRADRKCLTANTFDISEIACRDAIIISLILIHGIHSEVVQIWNEIIEYVNKPQEALFEVASSLPVTWVNALFSASSPGGNKND